MRCAKEAVVYIHQGIVYIDSCMPQDFGRKESVPDHVYFHCIIHMQYTVHNAPQNWCHSVHFCGLVLKEFINELNKFYWTKPSQPIIC